MAAAALGLGCQALDPAAGEGAAPAACFLRAGQAFFDKLIARRGLADPGVTLVTTKVELEEIRLKERKKKN